ncbi:MAG: hypothetical protein IJ364_02015 [Oscillospiraceae bacterium]|nr:hypothetical protein [Oscillospiraceae bacterium]
MNLEDLGRRLQQSGKADKIKEIAQSDAGARLSSMLDARAVEAAAKSGDNRALKNMLSQILSTEDGQKLAQSIKKIMEE